MKTPAYSLTRRLIIAVLLVEFCSAVALIGIAGVYESFSHFRAFDVMLHGRADSLLGAVQDAEDAQDNVMLDGTQGLSPGKDIYLVRDERGRILGSRNWDLARQQIALSDTREFRSVSVGGREYRVIREVGVRMVDPGDPGGGIPRHVTIFYGSPTHPVWERIRNAIAFYAVASLVLLVASGFVMFYLLRRGLEPLRQLAAQAALVSVNSWTIGNTGRAAEVKELEPLVSALDSALNRLEDAFAQQKQFVGDAAHELKTSVAVLKSSLQLLLMKARSAEQYEAGLRRLQLDCERMEELVAGMLTLAALEGEQQAEPRQPVDMKEIVCDVAEELRSLAELAHVTITVETPQPVPVAASPEKMRLLCSNLIHNAVQHSFPGGTVHVSVGLIAGSAELQVRDTGEGIDSQSLPHVFDRFYRADKSRSRQTGGTGLGLAISKAIVSSLRGDIRLDSRPGQGTTAIVALPPVDSASAYKPASDPVSRQPQKAVHVGAAAS